MSPCFPCLGSSKHKNVDHFTSDESLSCLLEKMPMMVYQEVAAATKNFSSECLLGEGGFGRVYKGQMKGTEEVVAVKQLNTDGVQGEREFLLEVLMLSCLNHPNLVNLIGCCADGLQRILVYEYMPLGSLEDHLHDLPPDQKPLDWNTRMKIAAGAAKGLQYLHERANPSIIYRDLKSANVLLGEGFQAKLSDFGLSKLGPNDGRSHVSTRVMGTYGYCAPEYAVTGKLTRMSDIYSFGVVLLEIITGRKAIDPARAKAEQNLAAWAKPRLQDRRKSLKMVDPVLKGRYPIRALNQALTVAHMCLQEQPSSRPLIREVASALAYLASQTDESDMSSSGGSPSSNNASDWSCNELIGIGSQWDDRKRAVAEALVWGEKLQRDRRDDR